MSAYIHHESPDCAISELDLFSLPPTNTQVESGSYVTYQPIASITNGGPLEFFITSSGEEYIQLSKTLLHIQASIKKGDGSTLPQAAVVGPANLILHSLFSQVDIYFNDRLVTASNNTYPYRCYLETLLNYGDDAKSTQFTTELWVKDTAGEMDDTKDKNKGLVQRRKLSGSTIDVIGRPHVDLFHQDRYLVNNVNIKARFIRAKPEFYLMSGDANPDYNVVIDSATLYVRKVRLSPSVALAHASVMAKGITLKYPFNRVETKVFTINSGLSSINRENIVIGQLPERVILGFVDAEAFNGSFKLNPFNFAHHKLTYLSVYTDSHPAKPLELDFEKDKYIRGYHSLFAALEKAERDSGNGISRNEYKSGYALYAFDLTPDLKAGGANFSLAKQGNLRVEIRFDEALKRPVCCVMMMEYESVLEIDHERNIHFDYSV